ncbi:MAG: DoxX family protein [Patescibacteria group bacterium]
MITPLFLLSDWALLVLRVVFGLVFIVHGWPKIRDLKANAAGFEAMGFKPGMFWGTIVAVLEFVGGLLIVAGLLTQVIALLLAVQMAVAILKVNLKRGFAGGYEFDLLLLAAGLLLVAVGGGDCSLDAFIGLVIY